MRKPRQLKDGADYHVVARINRSEMLFGQSNSYKTLFLEYVKKAQNIYSFEIKNICIMNNHVHMLIKPGKNNSLSNIMKSILGGFARRYNQINNLKGHVWYDRFKSRIINSLQQFINTLVYISNNPVRAEIVDFPWDYKYSTIYAILSKSSNYLVRLILSLMTNSDTLLINCYMNMIHSFNKESAKNTVYSIGFHPKKPGRRKEQSDSVLSQ